MAAKAAMNTVTPRMSLLCGIPGQPGIRSKMKPKTTPSPLEKEVQRLHANGKASDIIAIRLGMKMSKVLSVIAAMPKP